MLKILIRLTVFGMTLFISGQQCWGAAAPNSNNGGDGYGNKRKREAGEPSAGQGDLVPEDDGVPAVKRPHADELCVDECGNRLGEKEEVACESEWSHPDYNAHMQFLYDHKADAPEVGFYIDVIQELLYKAQLDNIVESGKTALIIAAKNGYYGVAKLLLQAGAQVNLREQRAGNTALMYAVNNGNHSMIDLLLEQGADVNIADIQDSTPLMVAIYQVEKSEKRLQHDLWGLDVINNNAVSRIAIVTKLLASKAQVNHINRHGNNPLMIALQVGKVEIVDALLCAGASTVFPDGKRMLDFVMRRYPLFHPVRERFEMQQFVDSGVCQVPSLQVLAAMAYVKAQEMKVEEVGIAPQAVDGTLVLADVSRAAQEIVGQCEAIRALMEQNSGDDVEAFRDAIIGVISVYEGNSEDDFFDLIEFFLKANPRLAIAYLEDLESPGPSYFPILCCAVESNRTDVVKLLLDSGANANAIAGSGTSILMYAIKGGNSEIVRTLLNGGAKHSIHHRSYVDVAQEDDPEQRLERMDALVFARRMGNQEIVAMLQQALK